MKVSLPLALILGGAGAYIAHRAMRGRGASRYVKLRTGKRMPIVGLGTWKSTKPGEAKGAVIAALDAGYRHVDCAAIYGNEAEIGEAFAEKVGTREGQVKREDLFVTSKLWNNAHAPADVEKAVRQTLQDLQLEYLDLYLIHWPTAFANTGDLGDKLPKNADGTIKYDLDTSIEATWNAMEGLVEKGLVKQIGVSNFNEEQIDRIMAASTSAKPSVLQVESHPYWMQKQLIAHARKHGIHVTAFSPLGSPDRPWAKEGDPLPMQHPDIAAVAARHSKSPAQVLIRFQVQRGVVVIPKSVTPSRIVANRDVFDFELSAEDLAKIEGTGIEFRACVPCLANGTPRDAAHPDFPFKSEFGL